MLYRLTAERHPLGGRKTKAASNNIAAGERLAGSPLKQLHIRHAIFSDLQHTPVLHACQQPNRNALTKLEFVDSNATIRHSARCMMLETRKNKSLRAMIDRSVPKAVSRTAGAV